jgi:transcriptional regulator with XRE-family HTH domain
MTDEFDKYEDVDDDQYDQLVVQLHLDEVLKKRNMTQKELAELTGIRPAAISQITRGFVDRLNLDHIGRIATALKINDIRELLTLQLESEVWNMSTVKQQREYLKEKEETSE